MRTIELRTTSREELVDITREVERRVTEAALIVAGGLQLGRWQRVFFCEFDGRRTRNVLLRLLASA